MSPSVFINLNTKDREFLFLDFVVVGLVPSPSVLVNLNAKDRGFLFLDSLIP